MSIIQEFKEFAIKGNMMDLAIGVIIGGAFGKIIDSLVKDIIMPLISVITGLNGKLSPSINWCKCRKRPCEYLMRFSHLGLAAIVVFPPCLLFHIDPALNPGVSRVRALTVSATPTTRGVRS